MSKEKIGHMKCENRKCGHRVVIRQNEHGTMSYYCDECDNAPYARKGTQLYVDWNAQIEKVAPAPAAKPAPGLAPKSSGTIL